jgi:uncharacterized membrane protein YgcG
MKINSKWNDNVITIDGQANDWYGNQLVPNGKHYAFGIMNDESNIYASFRTADPMIVMQILSNGLTVYIDTEGKKNKTFGIAYPLKQRRSAKGLMKLRQTDYDAFDQKLSELLEFQNQYEIVRDDDKDRSKFPLNADNGIEVKSSFEKGEFVYELRLSMNRPDLDIKKEQKIGIGFEIGAMDRSGMRPGGQSGMNNSQGSRGGSGGGQGGGGGRGQGKSQGRGPSMPSNDSIKLWMQVTLAQR